MTFHQKIQERSYRKIEPCRMFVMWLALLRSDIAGPSLKASLTNCLSRRQDHCSSSVSVDETERYWSLVFIRRHCLTEAV